MGLVCQLLTIYVLLVIAWIVLSWVRVPSTHPVGRVQVFLDRIMYPVILPLRRILPPLRLGGVPFDLSPLVLILGVRILQAIVC